MNTPHRCSQLEKPVSRRQKIPPPFAAGLVALRHRLVSDVSAQNLARIEQVHAASLPRFVLRHADAGLDKQETPSHDRDEASTDPTLLQRGRDGRYQECA